MDFDEARQAVQQHLDGQYADERESPQVRRHGFDTGNAWAPLIDWDGVMGVYIYLVNKTGGGLTPLSFPEFDAMPDPQRVEQPSNSRLHVVLARTRARMREGVPANHPGHSSQKSHGRQGGVRKSLKAAKTAEEVGAVLAAELEATMGRPVHVDLKGMDVGIARESAEGVLRGAEEFPDNELGSVTSYGAAGAVPLEEWPPSARPHIADAHAVTQDRQDGSHSDRILFNADKPAAAARSGFKRKGTVAQEPIGVGLHEFGHVVTLHKGRVGAAERAAKASATAAGEDFFTHLSTTVSPYASSSAGEMAAEAFTAGMLYGSGASPTAQAMFAAIKDAGGPVNRAALFAYVALSRERLLNHPGHADQKSHGRKGGVRSALAGAKSIEELNAAAAAEAKRLTGRDIEFDMTRSDLQVAKEHVEGVMRGLEKYPDVPLERVRQGMSSAQESLGYVAITDRDGSKISFSTTAQAGGPEAYRESLAEFESSGHIVAGTPMGVGLHEFGHVVTERGFADGGVSLTAERLARAAGQSTSEFVSEHVSSYATESGHEAAAESFADVMHNGSRASSASREMVETIDAFYAHSGGTIRT